MMFGFGHMLFGPGLLGAHGMVVPMMFVWIVPLVLIIWLVSSASSKQAVTHGCGPAMPVTYDPALQIVRERYARGEIDKATYERLVAELLGRS